MRYYSLSSHNRSYSEAIHIYEARIRDSKEIFEKFSDSFIERECPYCGSSRSTKHDLFYESYNIDKCTSCANIYVNPVPSLEAIDYYYNNCECNNMLGNLLRRRHKTNNVILSNRSKKVCNLIESYVSNKNQSSLKILEIGCNSGVFLSELRCAVENLFPDLDVQIFGIDIDLEAISKNVDKSNTLVCSSAEEYIETATSAFDIVLHFELIEHLLNPFNFNCAINSLLTPGGINFFTTPNGEGFDNVAVGYNKTRLLAHSIFPPMHLNAFSPVSIPIFALRSSFDIISIETPGIFDVDIVKLSYDKLDDDSLFKSIKLFSDDQLAHVQSWLQELKASVHMEVVLRKFK